jgi:hypothetical protein
MAAPIATDAVLRHAHMPGNDRLDDPLVDLERITQVPTAPPTGCETDLLRVVDDRRRRAVMRLVSLTGTALLRLTVGVRCDIGFHPVGRRRVACLELSQEGLEALQLTTKLLVLGKMIAPFVGGEGDGLHEPTLAHVSEGRHSRI